ncbi:hypothetical protein GCM10007920_21700 [Ciceribacter naphthalenivorans]|uniref:Uncharacterized protein n=2 Tax=Alphaproteobacteria TaxID=28211 RepID=A0A512HGA6_9HYPH|nr:hypothetical protein RNA01_13520 [Ciceribacter naphthalenivorans]GLR22383.1 hypothetical protein GCM10007920_21700 [Ciceribacter naphthalenivorans]GLT05239.1 hypothetical protein GCM10007926_21700 [Sphingomonas psychrolutea]
MDHLSAIRVENDRAADRIDGKCRVRGTKYGKKADSGGKKAASLYDHGMAPSVWASLL